MVDGTYQADGRVVALPGEAVRFCYDREISPAVGHYRRPGEPEPPPPGCAFGLDVEGVDLSQLVRRHEAGGGTEGYARLRGHVRSGVMRVVVQSRYRPAPYPQEALPTTPPCPRPAAGWAVGTPPMAAYETYDRTHPGEIIVAATYQPRPPQRVLVLFAEHPERVRRALGRNRSRVCVAGSRYAGAALRTAERALVAQLGPTRQGGVSSVTGPGIDTDNQLYVRADLMVVTPRLQAVVDHAPRGAVRLVPWLRPVRQLTVEPARTPGS